MPPANMLGYNVHTAEERAALLAAVGVESTEDLFSQIPESIRLRRPLAVPGPLSEWELERHFEALAAANATTRSHLSFLGGGAYDHYIPAVVPALAGRGEFLTAYTPYQPEMSQGLLRVLHDFQVLMGRLLGLPAVNCSVYDGATAMAEMAWMACLIKDRRRVGVAASIWPDYRRVLETYLRGREVSLVELPADAGTGQLDHAAVERILATQPCAALIFQTPNRFGVLESVTRNCNQAHAAGALANVNVNPLLLGVARSPGECGADIVCAEAQPLGIPLSAGGPYLGAVATHTEYAGSLPGRIVGELPDIKGEPALALIAEEREQHVSRDRATSHICSNQALLALRVVIHLSTLGEQGFREVARLSTAKAHALARKLTSIPGVSRVHDGPFFNEFLLRLPCPARELLQHLESRGILGGIDYSRFDPTVDNQLLVAVTERHSKADLDRMVAAVHTALGELA
ncbi:MAG: aminomethyl-transferring glycine dehydrogenase subunit GcvPA [Steroidobacteraceae bacterium]